MNGELRDVVSDALRSWEPRRIAYDLVLALIVVAYFAVLANMFITPSRAG
jgi:hypothetical protein